MHKDELLARCQTLLGQLRQEVEVARNMRRTDPLSVAEDVVCPVLSEVYGLPGLENLNVTERYNYPAIDLADSDRREAVQVTAEVTTRKIKDTLDRFFRHGLHEKYDRLRFLSLSPKQDSYPAERISEHVQAGFDFRVDRDVSDLSDVAEEISQLPASGIRRVVEALESELGQSYVVEPNISSQPAQEVIISNLIQVRHPSSVYSAKLAIDRERLIEATWNSKEVYSLKKIASWSKVVKAALRLDDQRPVNDFVVHEERLFSFHDLGKADDPFNDLIDSETVREMQSVNFYQESEDRQRLFVRLVTLSFSQRLYGLGVRYHAGQGMYFFVPGRDLCKPRRERWSSSNHKRMVYNPTCIEDDENGERLWYGKHLSFRMRFYLFGGQWHVAITPNWYFSADGWFEPYAKGGEKVSWLKHEEHNSEVSTHFRFINEFLHREFQEGLFDADESYYFPSLGPNVQFSKAPVLKDETWLQNESAEKKEKLETEASLFD